MSLVYMQVVPSYHGAQQRAAATTVFVGIEESARGPIVDSHGLRVSSSTVYKYSSGAAVQSTLMMTLT